MYEGLIKRLRSESTLHYSAIKDMRAAADAIEELMRRCEQFQYMPPPAWIPVTERLPKKPKNYPNCKLREYYFLVTLETNAVVCREYDFDNKRWPGTIRVTHWMPLPEPPKEKE